MVDSPIALNLRRIRKAKGFSQVDLADKSGLSRAAYRNIETGKSEPRVSNLQAIANALEVSVQQLVEPRRALRAVRFRSNKRMRSRDQILVDVARWLFTKHDRPRHKTSERIGVEWLRGNGRRGAGW